MNKWTLIVGFSVVAGAAIAEQGSYDYGLSGSISNPQRETVTNWLLSQQREAPVEQQSELRAQLYVDSQRRISDTFKSRIPDSLQEDAASTESTSN